MTTDRQPVPLTREEVSAIVEPFFADVLRILERLQADVTRILRHLDGDTWEEPYEPAEGPL